MEIAAQLFAGDSTAELGTSALYVLLRHGTSDPWSLVRDGVVGGRLEYLVLVSQIYDSSGRDRLNDWRAESLAELMRALCDAFPPEGDPPDHGGWVTPESQCRRLRNAIPGIIFERNQPGDRETLDRLVLEQPHLKRWYEQNLAEVEAKGVLGHFESQFLHIDTILDVLANADYRLVKSSNDLADVVEEQLVTIAQDFGADFELFYDSRTGARREEGTLQAYVLRRLLDRLRGRVLEPETAVHYARESRGHYGWRKDIVVDASATDGSSLSVVVEIKWSSNKETPTGLMSQLGEKYLRKEGKTHGIYLVAWNGKSPVWARLRLRCPRKLKDLQGLLDQQAKEYAAKHTLAIRAIVFDAVWPNQKRTKTRPPRARRGKSRVKTPPKRPGRAKRR
jgi:hypothetical protein